MKSYDYYGELCEAYQGDLVYLEDVEELIKELIEASEPFTSSDIVDELTATIPLMERLRKAIDSAKKGLDEANE